MNATRRFRRGILGLAVPLLLLVNGCPVATDQTPPVFSGLTNASIVSDTAVSLSWSAASDDETDPAQIVYLIYCSTQSQEQDFGNPAATAPAGATSCQVENLWPGTRYYFVVRAKDQAGNQDTNSAERDATTTSHAFIVQENPSGSDSEGAFSITMDTSYLYVAGQDSSLGNVQWRIEKRDRETGVLVTAFDGDGVVLSNPSTSVDTLFSIAVDANYLYAAGMDYSHTDDSQWRIEKRDKVTGALVSAFDGDGVVESNPWTNSDYAVSMTIDDSYLYVAGVALAGDLWRIEKRDKVTGALVSAFDGDGVVEMNPSSGDYADEIVMDESYIYVAGYCGTPTEYWRIEKRDKVTGALVSAFDSDGVVESDPSTSYDRVFGMAMDASSLYVTGFDNSLGPSNSQLRIEKRDKITGALVSAFDGDGVVLSYPGAYCIARSITVDASYLYVAGTDGSPGNGQWRIEKRNKVTGALVSAFDTDGVVQSNPSTGGDSANSIIVDNSYLYAAGGDRAPGNDQWRIEKRIIFTGGF